MKDDGIVQRTRTKQLCHGTGGPAPLAVRVNEHSGVGCVQGRPGPQPLTPLAGSDTGQGDRNKWGGVTSPLSPP